MSGLVLAPSILAADYACLGEQVREAEEAGAAWFHVDVMDGHFVPNLSIGIPVLESLKAVSDSFMDVHLMIDNPEVFLEPFTAAGADLITIHQEVATHLHRDIHEIRRLGCKVGVALNPSTPPETLREMLPAIDLVLCMTVNPGFGGQAFIPEVLDKVTRVREMQAQMGIDSLHVQVDGGIGAGNALRAARAGADVLVAGSSVFRGAGSVGDNYRGILRALAIEV
ncbi:MAG: ribulose-phosphate 3-epimerase [marine benthic group bacterium]|nr:ribulose-phosphate 3-epimerase [Candidatus Benthicola marisminoris]